MLKFGGICIAVMIVCFLLGSIPWGVVIGRVFFHNDPRDSGSGNIGATNSLRTLGKAGGAAVFVLDFLKGLAAGLVGAAAFPLAVGADAATIANLSPFGAGFITIGFMTSLSFLAVVLGHVFSPWLGWHGGKGISCAIGCLFITFGWQGALVELAVFAVVVIVFRYVSLGSICSAVACPVIAAVVFRGFGPAFIVCLLAAGLVVWAHRGNIVRLRCGTESRIGSH